MMPVLDVGCDDGFGGRSPFFEEHPDGLTGHGSASPVGSGQGEGLGEFGVGEAAVRDSMPDALLDLAGTRFECGVAGGGDEHARVGVLRGIALLPRDVPSGDG
jgi:hypothetical protein